MCYKDDSITFHFANSNAYVLPAPSNRLEAQKKGEPYTTQEGCPQGKTMRVMSVLAPSKTLGVAASRELKICAAEDTVWILRTQPMN